jgi:hypothetical protein
MAGKNFVYIVQAHMEQGKCKIGITDNLERRLREYNAMTGKSKDNPYRFLFSCEIKAPQSVEADIKKAFSILRETSTREIYFYNEELFSKYVDFIKHHKNFIKEIFLRPKEKAQVVKIVKKTTPTLEKRGITRKEVMQKAKQVGNDEFYTRYEDIEKEIAMHPASIWKNKVVFCNCDDAVGTNETNTSAFASFFLNNFTKLGLKKLICTHFGGIVDLFNAGTKGYVFTRDGFSEISNLEALKEYPKGYDGDFRHPLSLKILNEEADIVCTNPPFSLAIEYWDTTIKSKKKFLIISNVSNAINTAFIHYFKTGKVHPGYNEVDWFQNPKRELTRAAGHWFTNFPIKKRPASARLKIMPLKQIPERYKEYDNSATLLVNNNYIPSDYKKPFAVSARAILNGLLENGYRIVQERRYTPYDKTGRECFARVLVQKTGSKQ